MTLPPSLRGLPTWLAASLAALRERLESGAHRASAYYTILHSIPYYTIRVPIEAPVQDWSEVGLGVFEGRDRPGRK